MRQRNAGDKGLLSILALALTMLGALLFAFPLLNVRPGSDRRDYGHGY
jgi:hypothetical protein